MGGSDEWQECRLTIGRFDGFLADTRKYGFTLVTILLTANALVTSGDTAVDRPAASIVVMTLLFALFMLDNYYWDLLRGAVDRAKELEKKDGEGKSIQLSGVISTKVANSHATALILAVYALFVLVAAGIGLTAGAAAKPGTPWGQIILLVVAAAELLAMAGVFLVVQPTAPTARWFYATRRGKRAEIWRQRLEKWIRKNQAAKQDSPV